MIKKYEAEVYKLTKELETSRQHIHQERVLRQQLEDELRQMFLKNMTSMNIEAFKIFQQAQISRENILKSLHVEDDLNTGHSQDIINGVEVPRNHNDDSQSKGLSKKTFEVVDMSNVDLTVRVPIKHVHNNVEKPIKSSSITISKNSSNVRPIATKK
jgi:hypothetical protein